MKVKLLRDLYVPDALEYTKAGTVIEVSESRGEELIAVYSAELAEGDAQSAQSDAVTAPGAAQSDDMLGVPPSDDIV
jgi:hypothetical protein